MKNYTHKILATVAAVVTGLTNVYSQTNPVNEYENMSLKDLLNVKIVSASKASESLFEAPLSASVVTKEDILRAGCTSIMEALRLVPGIIVREQTNGNFDVQIRGAYTTPNAFFDGSSGTTLVMVDNRPIFNYLKGSTFWETIPVDLNDIEKIEVVRGPAGALYGPNAVNGVIHIITTRQATKKGLYALANSSQGSYHTNINNASLGYKGDKWGLIASGNFQHRERTQTSYYEFLRNDWFDPSGTLISELGTTLPDSKALVPYPEVAVEKYGANIFAQYDPEDKVSFNLSTGLQHSLVQKVSSENGVGPLTTSASDSRYVDLRAKAGQFTGQVSFIKGVQSADHQSGNKYDFYTLDASIGYDYAIGNLSLKPGLSYRTAVYDDTKYSDTLNKLGIFNARGEIITKSASLRSEYKLLHKKLRLIAGVATNTFNYPDKTYLSYEFASTYKLSGKHLLRAAWSSTPRSASIYDTYVNQSVPLALIGPQKYLALRLEGNKNIPLLTAKMFELGYRGHVTEDICIDVELFQVHTDNYSITVMQAAEVKIQDNDTLVMAPISPTNLPVTGNQLGGTISLTWSPEKWQLKPYVTIQQFNIENYAPYTNMPGAPSTYIQPNPLQNNIYSGMGSTMEMTNTPTVFGGMTVNYEASKKLNVNLNAYYLSAQTIYHSTYTLFKDGVRGVDHLKGKCILNANVSYKLTDRLQLNASFKNMLNNTSREYYKTDEVPFWFLGGIHFDLNP